MELIKSKAIICFLVTLIICLVTNEIIQCKPLQRDRVANSYPVVVENGNDSFLILNDDEVLQNKEILKHLSAASKEEVEEIIDNNPVIQAALLNKIKNAVGSSVNQGAQRPKTVGSGGAGSGHHDHVIIIHGGEQDDSDDDDDGLDNKKLEMWQAKFKNKAAKIFKVGASFKNKLLALRDKKKRPKTVSLWPHFHYNLSTS